MKTVFPHPIFVTSPVRRAGTTLVQRLLCSASNTLIYGETCANDLTLFTNLFLNKQMLLAPGKNRYNQQLQTVLDGSGLNEWIPNLLPDIDFYLEAQQNMVVSMLQSLADFAGQQGRPVWGMKMPEWNPVMLLQIQQLFPGSRIIYLHRNLEDCVRSAKKIEMVIGPDEIRQFCQTWRQFTDYARQHFTGPNSMHIDYDQLVGNPTETIQKLEAFSGATAIDPAIMGVKVNTHEGDHRLKIGNGHYLQPADLNAEEMEIVQSFSIASKPELA